MVSRARFDVQVRNSGRNSVRRGAVVAAALAVALACVRGWAAKPGGGAPPPVGFRYTLITAGAVTIVGGWNGDTQAWKATCTPGALGSGVALQSLGFLYSDSRTPGRSSAYGVNNLGEVIGATTTAREDSRAARYTDSGGWVSLGTLAPSSAKSWNDSDGQAINDAGYAVGESMVGNVNAVPNIRAFIQHDSFGIRDLASLVDGLASADAGVLGRPAAINNDNYICGPLVTNFYGVETKQAYVLAPYAVNP